MTALLLALLAAAPVAPAPAEDAGPPTTAAPPAPLTTASGATLTIQTEAAVPGGLLVFDVRGVSTNTSIRGVVAGEKLKFFAAGKRHLRALVGLTLEQAAGPLPVKMTLRHGKVSEELATEVQIASKEFRKSELKVAPRFVTPPKSEKQHIEEDKKEVSKAYHALPFGPATFVGKLSLPRDSEITAHFGDQRIYNGKKKNAHQGTDFDGRIGDPIKAAADGVVVLARGCYYSGNTVIVWHGGGLFTSYFHMSRMDVHPGMQVARGDQLGVVGKTGRVTGPHLHLGVKIHDRLVDAEEAFKLDLGLDKGTKPVFPELPADAADGGLPPSVDGGELAPIPLAPADAGPK